MAKNRVIYQSDALFVSKGVDSTGASEHAQLRRVQSANYSFNVARQDVNQFGQLSRLEAIILEAPTVSFDASYLLGDGFNEQALGFANGSGLNKGFISGQIASTSGQNLYILTAPEGTDANFNTTSTSYSTIGIGNAFLTDYTLDASIGSIPTVSVSFEGTNMNATAGVSGTINGISGVGYSGISGVGIDPTAGTVLSNQSSLKRIFDYTAPTNALQSGRGIVFPPASQGTGVLVNGLEDGDASRSVVTALRPGDISLSFANADGDAIVDLDGEGAAHVQSVSISVPLGRTPIDRLGSRFSFARVVDFPITPTLSVSAIVSDTQTRALTDIINNDDFIDSITILFKDSDSTLVAGNPSGNLHRAAYKLTKLKLDSEAFSSSIGPNKTVDLSFSLSIGGPEDTVNNVFFSGANTGTVLGNTQFTT